MLATRLSSSSACPPTAALLAQAGVQQGVRCPSTRQRSQAGCAILATPSEVLAWVMGSTARCWMADGFSKPNW